jgi:hypothetical protein
MQINCLAPLAGVRISVYRTLTPVLMESYLAQGGGGWLRSRPGCK